DVYGGWNTLRPFAIDNATGELVIGTKLSASLNGNALTATKLQMRIPLYSITDWHRSPISDSHPFDQPGT
ncbi:hypothetical protein GQN26_27685, partial [Escherichia coli]|nr:hypothetical protein [Escherichia coli]MWP60742.1 hypothetical protein [Escherichia coli]